MLTSPLYIAFAVAVIAYAIWSRLKFSRAAAANADKNFGAVAARLGMTVVEGDPHVNLLYFLQPTRDYERTLKAAGQPYGRPASFALVDGKKTSEYLVARTIKTTFGCFLEVHLSVSVPPFELVLRNPNAYVRPHLEFNERTELAEIRTGNPQIDGHFVVRSADPRMGPMLVGALSLLSTHLYVHVAGEGQRIWMSFARVGLNYLSHAPEEYLLALETLGCAFEGRPAPAALPVPPRPAMQAAAGAP